MLAYIPGFTLVRVAGRYSSYCRQRLQLHTCTTVAANVVIYRYINIVLVHLHDMHLSLHKFA